MFHLQARLATMPSKSGRTDPERSKVLRTSGQIRHGANARSFGQLASLIAREEGDQAQVIISYPRRLAVCEPSADGAMRNRQRIGLGAYVCEYLVDEPGLGSSVVGGEVMKRKRLTRAVSEKYVDLPGSHTLQTLYVLGVEAELQHRRRIHVTRKLRVLRFVRVITKLTRTLYAPEEVRVPTPDHPAIRFLDKGGLKDDIHSRSHGCLSPIGRLAHTGERCAVALDLGHREPSFSQLVQIGTFVLEPSTAQHVQLGICSYWEQPRAGRRLQ
jgi:hypothetical protein